MVEINPPDPLPYDQENGKENDVCISKTALFLASWTDLGLLQVDVS